MESFMDNVLKWSKEKTERLSKNMKETLDHQHLSEVALLDMATFILRNSNTMIKQKKLLGNVYNFCNLKVQNIALYLETKGENHQQILELKVIQNGNVLSWYRSYEQKNTSKETKVKIPENINHLLNKNVH